MTEKDNELIRQTHGLLQELVRTTTTLESHVTTLATTQAVDHDTLTALAGTMAGLESSSRETATASIKVAALAEQKAAWEAEDREAAKERDAAEALVSLEEAKNRGKVLSTLLENWKLILVVVVLILSGNGANILALLGVASPMPSIPPAAQVAPAPAPVVPHPVLPGE